jgi:hypothetical protein
VRLEGLFLATGAAATANGRRPLVLADVELNPPGQYADGRNLAAFVCR